ncbi:MAG: TIGR00269 family protein [Candidatus Poseidoniaceae archaeon]|jgi:uncharacterized protein (TIGR00269 family)|nr:TIGR00269 family protein [Candidatus Poseidoniaceae archaeon]
MAGRFEVPGCDKCRNPAIHHQIYSGRMMCGNHLSESVEKKVSKALRKQLVIPKGNNFTILVAISGGKDSAVLLERIVGTLGMRPDVTIIGGCVDEGIEGYRPPSLECARTLCEDLGVRFETVSYPELGFKEMDEVVVRMSELSEAKAPCSFCGVFRRQGINHLARRVEADVIALGHNLDDMAQTIMMNLQNGDLERTLRLAPHTYTPIEGIQPRIVPLRWIPEQEIHLYALHKKLPIHHEECPHGSGALRFRHRETIAWMESDVPGTRHGLLRMTDDIKALNAKSTENRPPPPSSCPECGEICSGEICKGCEMKKLLFD